MFNKNTRAPEACSQTIYTDHGEKVLLEAVIDHPDSVMQHREAWVPLLMTQESQTLD